MTGWEDWAFPVDWTMVPVPGYRLPESLAQRFHALVAKPEQAAPGVKRRKAGEPKPAPYRRHPEPQGDFAEEAADAAMAEVDRRKEAVNHRGKRRR